jgi:ribonuclease J
MTPGHSNAVTPSRDEVLFLPLGGTGEIGMNLTLYGHDGQWLIVDTGITFGNDDFPEHDVMMADTAFIEARREQLAGIVLTHGHEDHLGALPYLWRRLRCPVYATPFTAALAHSKLNRAGLEEVPLHEVGLGARFAVGGFQVEMIGMTHSIPEPNALLIDTPAGAILHTGDWKLDPSPVIGDPFDRRRLQTLSREPLLAMVCDSTNAVVPGHTASESSLFEPLKTIANEAPGRLVVTTFASNVARLVTLARVAAATGRRFGVIGQAMQRMVGVAQAVGYWPDDLPRLVPGRDLGYLPREEVLAACTGSQGEPRSAMARLATDSHRDLLLEAGDTVVFSSRLIPGNERPVERLMQGLRERRLAVITDHDEPVHVSGHPAEDDLRQLYAWVQPTRVIPVHGTPRHLAANARIARASHVPETLLVRNGDLCRLDRYAGRVIGQVENGRLSPDADGLLLPVGEELLARMRRAAC